MKQKASFHHIEAIDTTKSIDHLLTIEAIRDLKPELNTKDEFRNKELTVKL